LKILMRNVCIFSFLVTVFSGCTFEQISRNVYEGAKVYDKSLKSTPLEKSTSDLPSYDQYEKERRGGGTRQSE